TRTPPIARRLRSRPPRVIAGRAPTVALAYAADADSRITSAAALVQLSPEQKAAVQYVRGPLLVLGETGTGKTSLLAHKAAWLLRDYDVEPRALLILATSAATVAR